jgi:hypothetical protein
MVFLSEVLEKSWDLLLAGLITALVPEALFQVLPGLLGKRAALFYLGSIAVFSILFGLLVDSLYPLWGLSPRAIMGQAGVLIPGWAQGAGAALLLVLSLKPLAGKILLPRRLRRPVPISARPKLILRPIKTPPLYFLGGQ